MNIDSDKSIFPTIFFSAEPVCIIDLPVVQRTPLGHEYVEFRGELVRDVLLPFPQQGDLYCSTLAFSLL